MPESASLRLDPPNASWIAAPHARSSAAWCSSSKTTNASRATRRSRDALVATCWYEVTTPCMSAGSFPSADDHCGSRWSENAAAACAHCTFRWAVGATTIRRRGLMASSCRAAVSAKVVLPAPGVATARKSGLDASTNWSRAAFCHGLSRTIRVIWASPGRARAREPTRRLGLREEANPIRAANRIPGFGRLRQIEAPDPGSPAANQDHASGHVPKDAVRQAPVGGVAVWIHHP